MNTHISIIFKITDRFKKRALLAPEVTIRADGQRLKPLYKPGGYFIYTDLPPGEALFEISSAVFQTEKVAAVIPAAEDGYVMSHLMMSPSRQYHFEGRVTMISGRLLRESEPLATVAFHIVVGSGGEMMKIAEDGAGAGNDRIRLFVSVPERQLSIPGKYMIKEKDEEKQEFCLITQCADKDGRYLLEKGMAFSHPRATPLVEAVECVTSVDGGFFIALHDLKDEKPPVDFLIPGLRGKAVRKSFEIRAGVENDLGTVQI